MAVEFARPEANLARMIGFLRETARAGTLLTAFPECVLTGYCFETLDEARPCAEPIPGPSTLRLAEACRELGVYALFGLLEADGDRLFNACVLVGPDGVAGKHRKIHMPYLGIDRFATPGDTP